MPSSYLRVIVNHMKKMTHTEPQVRQPGDFFKEVTGSSVAEYKTVEEIQKAIEKKLGHQLKFAYFNSTVVPRRGDIFPHVETDMKDLEKQLERYLRA